MDPGVTAGLCWLGHRGVGGEVYAEYGVSDGIAAVCIRLRRPRNMAMQVTAANAAATAPPPTTHAHTGSLEPASAVEDDCAALAVAVAE